MPNPYLKNRVGVGKFALPKSTIAPPKPSHGPQTAGTPIHGRIGRGNTDQTATRTERTPKNPTTTSRSTGGADLTISITKNSHITRKNMGKTYNTASEADPAPPQITTEEWSNLPGQSLTECDHKLRTVCVDHIHHNDGTHLTGGIANDDL